MGFGSPGHIGVPSPAEKKVLCIGRTIAAMPDVEPGQQLKASLH